MAARQIRGPVTPRSHSFPARSTSRTPLRVINTGTVVSRTLSLALQVSRWPLEPAWSCGFAVRHCPRLSRVSQVEPVGQRCPPGLDMTGGALGFVIPLIVFLSPSKFSAVGCSGDAFGSPVIRPISLSLIGALPKTSHSMEYLLTLGGRSAWQLDRLDSRCELSSALQQLRSCLFDGSRRFVLQRRLTRFSCPRRARSLNDCYHAHSRSVILHR